MCSRSELCRICRLVNDCLRPYTDLEAVSITRENEKNVLVALSRILAEIQLRTHELSSSPERGMVVKPDCTSQLSDGPSGPYCEDCPCISKILGDLIVLLAVQSQFVRHLAGNVLVLLSEFVAACGSKWAELIDSFCVVLEWAISNLLSDHLMPSRTKAEAIYCGTSSCILVLKSRLKYFNWLTVAGIVRVLHNILKYLRQEDDGQLLKLYFQSITSCLSSPCWDLLEVHVDLRSEAQRSSGDAAQLTSAGKQELVVLFLGHVARFFCSLVGGSDQEESAGVSQHKSLVICEISNLVPKVFYWCLDKQGDCKNSCISQYFRHKILKIIIRLSFHGYQEQSRISSWLQILHKYFQDLLSKPLMQTISDSNNCLEDSPFLLSFSDEVLSMCSHHLQRQAVFLFLKCSVSLINMREGINGQCLDPTQNIYLKNDMHGNPGYCSREKGLLELHEWLQVHLPTNTFVDYEIFMENCIKFSLSFLQLFINEDDILFEVLLQLHTLPSFTGKWICKRKESFKDAKKDIHFLLWNIFNPVHLFHLFLSELCYDHEVLLDYLISKDTGISCAEYLLRCLRVVCDSWNSFVEFPPVVEVSDQPPWKKSKVFPDSPPLQVEPSSPPEPGGGHGILLSLVEKSNGVYKLGNNHLRSKEEPFQEAKHCLLVLKESVLNLHHKNLFPYNPGVLLKRYFFYYTLTVFFIYIWNANVLQGLSSCLNSWKLILLDEVHFLVGFNP